MGGKMVLGAEETFYGGKAGNALKGMKIPRKQAVFSVLVREGEVRAFHVTNVNAKTLRPILVQHADRKSFLMTDESAVYPTVGEEFAGHGTVNHSAEEYVRGTFYYTNTVESYFAILKRGIMEIGRAHV